jgi:hypothetical protein
VRFRNGPVPLTHDFESFGRVTGSGCAGAGTSEQGHRIRPWHQPAYRRSSPGAHDGAPGRASVCRGDPAGCAGRACGRQMRQARCFSGIGCDTMALSAARQPGRIGHRHLCALSAEIPLDDVLTWRSGKRVEIADDADDHQRYDEQQHPLRHSVGQFARGGSTSGATGVTSG